MALYKVDICGVNTSKLPLLSEEEKRELFEKIKQGDAEARERYIQGNLRLVLSILQRFAGSKENMDDLFQIGCVGLIKAVDNFDDSLNVKFSTYAVPMIAGELKRFLRDNAAIRVSRSVKDVAYKAIYCRERIAKTTNRDPSISEIAKEIGIKEEDIAYALDAIQSPVSLFEPVYEQGGDTLYVMDQISDKKNKEEKWVESIVLEEALARLSKRERRIIDMRFFNGKTQMEIADEIGISQAQVSRLEKNALKVMKHYIRS
ncbi:MAG: RNA polymerase sporulation sigma factor SigG [Eubacterium sp.]|nr:RNA polymerase sporulation sigma factor SigG [Eubacterium sp.]